MKYITAFICTIGTLIGFITIVGATISFIQTGQVDYGRMAFGLVVFGFNAVAATVSYALIFGRS